MMQEQEILTPKIIRGTSLRGSLSAEGKRRQETACPDGYREPKQPHDF